MEKTSPRNIRREITGDQICLLTFDRPDSSANVFDEATLLELNEHLDFITNNPQLKGVVLTSAKPAIFIAGADLHALARLQPPDLLHLIELGQSVFNRIVVLCIPTVAAIHGACVGGGYEVCLACDHRIASDDRVTKIGLPETQLGILPAWGGSTRLPRLIGLPKALDVILGGKTLAARPALKRGMIDELAPKERLVELACRKILSAGLGLRRRSRRFGVVLANNALAARLIAARARIEVMKKTRGHYPAVLKALEVVSSSVTQPLSESLGREREAILQLAQTAECRNLFRVFFLQERAKKLKVGQAASLSGGRTGETPVQRCAVIGAGVMGAGIAQWLSARGLPVILRDINAAQVGRGMVSVSTLYSEGAKRHLFNPVEARSGMDRIFPASGEVPLHNVDLVIEAAVEKLDLKKKMFHHLDELAGPDTILATNTSALSVSEIAATTSKPERVVGIHFFNPVHRMQLVEVVAGRQTSAEVLQRTVRFVQRIGKLPVVVRDSPGFLVNRTLVPYLLEAGQLFEGGARIDEIDEAMLDFGMPMGPLRLIDEVGVDVASHVAETLAASFSDRLSVPIVLSKMMRTGLLGRKSEHGFYRYNEKVPRTSAELSLFRTGDWAKDLGLGELQRRMVLLMVNEAARCLEEQVVSAPEDVDFAMIMGAGFAPFLGGPLRYADSVGVQQIVEQLSKFSEHGETRFEPCTLLQAKAANGETFYPEKGVAP